MTAVMDALVRSRLQEHLQEQEKREAAVAAIVAERLTLTTVERDKSEWPVFKAWCDQHSLTAFPARPSAVAAFVLDQALLGGDKLMKIVEAISATHEAVADPTLGTVVTSALDHVSPSPTPPPSWPKEDRLAFLQIPRQLQLRIIARDENRDAAVRKAQNDAASARQELAAIQQPAKKIIDANQSQPTA